MRRKKLERNKLESETAYTAGSSFTHTSNLLVNPQQENRSVSVKNIFKTILLSGAVLFFVDSTITTLTLRLELVLPVFISYSLTGAISFYVTKALLKEYND